MTTPSRITTSTPNGMSIRPFIISSALRTVGFALLLLPGDWRLLGGGMFMACIIHGVPKQRTVALKVVRVVVIAFCFFLSLVVLARVSGWVPQGWPAPIVQLFQNTHIVGNPFFIVPLWAVIEFLSFLSWRHGLIELANKSLRPTDIAPVK